MPTIVWLLEYGILHLPTNEECWTFCLLQTFRITNTFTQVPNFPFKCFLMNRLSFLYISLFYILFHRKSQFSACFNCLLEIKQIFLIFKNQLEWICIDLTGTSLAKKINRILSFFILIVSLYWSFFLEESIFSIFFFNEKRLRTIALSLSLDVLW